MNASTLRDVEFREGPATVKEILLVSRIAGNMDLIIKLEAMLDLAVGRSTFLRESYLDMVQSEFLALIPQLMEAVGGMPDIPKPFLEN